MTIDSNFSMTTLILGEKKTLFVPLDDEIRCFDITVFADVNYRYCCFTVVDGFELQYIDCDAWIGD